MSAVLVSVAPLHAERIPLERTWVAIQAAEMVFGPGRVMVYQDQWAAPLHELGGNDRLPLSAWEEAYGREQAGRLLWDGYGLIPGGRSGYRLGDLRQGLPAETFMRQTCRQDILYAHHSHFDLYGNYIPGFCGGLIIGSWKAFDAQQVAAHQGEFPALIAHLIAGGPYRLFKLAKEQYGYKSRAGGYAGKCHLCVDVRRHLQALGEFPELAPSEFYEYF